MGCGRHRLRRGSARSNVVAPLRVSIRNRTLVQMVDADSLLTHLIARPGADEARIREVLDDAVAAVPGGYRPLDAPELLPATKLTDRCRLCGLVTELTREHIPPKAAGNDRIAWSHTVDDWLERDALGELRGGTHTQGGIRGYTLCGSCNSKTGELYGEEYKSWALRGFQILTQLPHPAEIDAETEQKVASVEFRDVRPGRFVRQVLSCMCSLSADWDLAEQSREIRSFVLDGEAGSMPAGLSLGDGALRRKGQQVFWPATTNP